MGSVSGTYPTVSVGGLVGANYSSVSESYATGAVVQGGLIGGLLGYNAGSVSNSYWNINTTGRSTSAGGTGLTTAQMRTQSNFSSWDFTNTWIGYDGFTNPLLRSFMTPLTVTANYATKTYDGQAYSGGNGVTYSSTPNANLLGTVSYSGTSQGATNAGGYVITPGGLYSNQQGYIISYVDGTLWVYPAYLTLSGLSGTSRAYNGSPVDALTGTATLNGLVPGESLTLGGTANGTLASPNAGSQAVTTAITIADGTGLASNYFLIQPALADVTIAQAPLTVSGLSGTSRTYNGSMVDALSGTGTLSGLISGETLTLGNTANGTLANANAGSQAVSTALTLADGTGLASNYVLTQPTLTNVTISKAALTVSSTDVTKTYDGTLGMTGATGNVATVTSGTLYTNASNGNTADTLSGGTFAYTNANAGTNTKTVTTTGVTVNDGNSGGNYAVSYADNTHSTINPAALTVSTTDVTKTYDGTLGMSGATGQSATVTSGTLYTNASNSNAADSLSGGTFAYTNANAGTNNKTVTTIGVIVNDGNSGGNYTVSYADNTTSTINKAPLTVSGLSGTSRTYNGSTVDALTGTGTLSGLISGETLTLGNAVNGTLASANAGSEAVSTSITLVNGTGLASNYVLTQPALANVTISPLAATLTGTRSYDGTAVINGGVLSVSNLASGDRASLSGSGTLASKDIGIEAITDFGSLFLSNSNYTLTGGSGSVNVTVPIPPSTSIVPRTLLDAYFASLASTGGTESTGANFRRTIFRLVTNETNERRNFRIIDGGIRLPPGLLVEP